MQIRGLKDRLFTQRNIVIILFVTFIFIRLFVDSPYSFYSSDNVKYLETANRFPYHTFYNNQLYLLHPPFFPYTIHFFTLIFKEDYIAAIFVSLISSIVAFLVLHNFFMMLTKNFKITFFVLLFFTLSDGFIIVSHRPIRESFQIMLIFLTLFYYARGIKFDNSKSMAIAIIPGSILALSSDHFVLLIPALLLTYLFLNSQKINLLKFKFPNLKFALLPIVIMGLFYGSWVVIKFLTYIQYDYYPNGEEGTPVNMQNFGFWQLFNPELFSDIEGPYIETGLISIIKKLFFNFGYMFNIEPFSIPGGLNLTTMNYLLLPKHIVYMSLIYVPLFLIAMFGFYSVLRQTINGKKLYKNIPLYLLLLFLVFLFPITQKYTSPRYIYTSYILLYYLIGYGTVLLLTKKRIKYLLGSIIPTIVILLMILLPFWYLSNPYFVFFTKKVVSAQNTAEFINKNIDKDAAIMAQPGYGAKIIYLTGRRTVGLYPKPEYLLDVIKYYNISYILFGRYYTYDAYYYAKNSVEFVKNEPNKFELIATIHEDYTNFLREEHPGSTDEVYIYKVKNIE